MPFLLPFVITTMDWLWYVYVMEPWMWAIVLKPLGLIVLFSFTWACAQLLRKHMPDSKLKRFLFFSWRV